MIKIYYSPANRSLTMNFGRLQIRKNWAESWHGSIGNAGGDVDIVLRVATRVGKETRLRVLHGVWCFVYGDLRLSC